MKAKREFWFQIVWMIALMVPTVASCGTFGIEFEGPENGDVEAEKTVSALETEISVLATQLTAVPMQETAISEATPGSVQWDMDPIAGIVYHTDHALWQMDAEGNPRELMSLHLGMEDFRLSQEGDRVLYTYRDDIWIADLITGEQRNITQTDDRRESRPYWWPAYPDIILFSSVGDTEEWGTLTVSRLDGSEYKVLGEKPMYAPPAPSPDGELIAFSTHFVEGLHSQNEAWLYHWDGVIEPIEPNAYQLVVEGFNGVSWAPGGKKLTWVVSNNIGKAALVLIDLDKDEGEVRIPFIMGGCWPTSMPPIWSPSGEWFVIEASCGEPAETMGCVMNLEGENKGSLYTGRDYEMPFPVWRPDGKMLAFQNGDAISVSTEDNWARREAITPPGATLVDWRMVDG
jgi:hypothetical protein